MTNHYTTLGISETASIEEIHQAHKKLVRANNPIRLTGRARSEAEERLRIINSAFNVLKNPEKRRTYDATLPPPAKTRASRSEPVSSVRKIPKRPAKSSPPPPPPPPPPKPSSSRLYDWILKVFFCSGLLFLGVTAIEVLIDIGFGFKASKKVWMFFAILSAAGVCLTLPWIIFLDFCKTRGKIFGETVGGIISVVVYIAGVAIVYFLSRIFFS